MMTLPQLLLAGLAWANVSLLLWFVLFGQIEPGWRAMGVWLFWFVVALLASFSRERPARR
jgi:hypothetical protein